MHQAPKELKLKILPGQKVEYLAEPLYTDHKGAFVFCDWEGAGIYEDVDNEATVTADGIEVGVRSGRFSERLLITHRFAHPIRGRVMSADAKSLVDALSKPGRIETERQVLGCGWLQQQARCSIDGGAILAYPPGEPYFRSIHPEAGAKLAVLPAASMTEHLCHFKLGDDESLRSANWNVNRLTQPRLIDGIAVVGCLSAATFTVQVPTWTKGLGFRRKFDAFHGMQRARIFVGGSFAGVWFQPKAERNERLREDSFIAGVPAEAVGSGLGVRIEPSAGSPLWSIASMDVYAIG